VTIHKLSFADFIIHEGNILEVKVHTGIEMSLEMIDECSHFVEQYITSDFGMLVNKVNNYTYSYEAQLCLASYANLKAIALVHYSSQGLYTSTSIVKIRSLDLKNIETFAGKDHGWQEAMNWLKQELCEPLTN